MQVARDIEGFILPFATGVLLTAFAGISESGASIHAHILILFGIAVSVFLLLQRKSLELRPFIIQSVIVTSAILCGILSGLLPMPVFPASHIEITALGFCERLQEAIDKIPFKSPETGALIKALLTGERSSLPREMAEAFRDSGASHILALSGLHLGIIYGVISRILGIFGNDIAVRRIRSALLVAACGFYTLATGAGPSITRAFLFILLGEIARMTGRVHSMQHTLMAALLLQLTISPMSIRSIGFQLSYAAIAGIAFIYPWLKDFWPSDKTSSQTGSRLVRGVKWIWSSLALSISCQITTAPLVYIYFGTFPQHFMLTNLIALPLTGILIPSALIALVMSHWGYCPIFLTTITEFLVQVMTGTLHIISTM